MDFPYNLRKSVYFPPAYSCGSTVWIEINMSNDLKEQADYTIHSGWGDNINWLVSDWNSVDFNKDILSVYGHLSSRPSVGQTLYGEFQHSHILFEFVEVEYKFDPPDMFFAKVTAIKQEMK